MRRKGFFALILAAVIGVAAIGIVLAQGSAGRESPAGSEAALNQQADPRQRDAEEYAKMTGVSLDEAVKHLEWQNDPETRDALRKAAGDRWLGAWTQREPDWKFVVRVTGDSLAGLDELQRVAASAPYPVEILTGTPWTREELNAVMEEIVGDSPESYAGGAVDAETGGIFLLVIETTELGRNLNLAADLSARYGVPVTVDLVEGRGELKADAAEAATMRLTEVPYDFEHQNAYDVFGGAHIWAMIDGQFYGRGTAGFTVWDWLGGEGVVTAGHLAEPTNIYWYPNIPAIQAEFVWKYLDDYYDIRYLKTHGNEIGYWWDGYNLRPVEGNIWQAHLPERLCL